MFGKRTGQRFTPLSLKNRDCSKALVPLSDGNKIELATAGREEACLASPACPCSAHPADTAGFPSVSHKDTVIWWILKEPHKCKTQPLWVSAIKNPIYQNRFHVDKVKIVVNKVSTGINNYNGQT